LEFKINNAFNKIPEIIINDKYNKFLSDKKVIEREKTTTILNVIYNKTGKSVGFFGAFDIQFTVSNIDKEELLDITNSNENVIKKIKDYIRSIKVVDLFQQKVIYTFARDGFYKLHKNGKEYYCQSLWLIHNIPDMLIIRPRLVELKNIYTYEYDYLTDTIKEFVDNKDIIIRFNKKEVDILNYFDLPYIYLYDIHSNIPFRIDLCVNKDKLHNFGILLIYSIVRETTHYDALLGFIFKTFNYNF